MSSKEQLTPALARSVKMSSGLGFSMKRLTRPCASIPTRPTAETRPRGRHNSPANCTGSLLTVAAVMITASNPRPSLKDLAAAAASGFVTAEGRDLLLVDSDPLRLLDRLATGSSTEAALQSVLRISYADLDAETIRYLKKTYGQ